MDEDIHFAARCVCPPDFDGEFCEHYRCSGYCKNRGTCRVQGASGKPVFDPRAVQPPLHCSCQPQWTGERCDVPMSYCRERCHNGATCTVRNNTVVQCQCAAGYTGPNCQNCLDLECQNGGVCKWNVTASAASRCDCAPGYTGARCEDAICDGYCNGNGLCRIQLVGPVCECNRGFWGKQCQSDTCRDFCENGGRCTNDNARMRCECPEQYRGDRCQVPVCKEGLCEADGVPETTTTTMPTGAAAAAEPCDRLQCLNGGTCHVLRDRRPVCNCTAEFYGENCAREVGKVAGGACTMELCRNGGICVRRMEEGRMRTRCECAGDWVGDRCDGVPRCEGECGVCRPDGSLNECL